MGTDMTGMTPTSAPIGVPVLHNHSLRHALPEGSRVLSARGEVPIETLAPADRIITRDHGLVSIRDVVRMAVPEGTTMIRIPAHAMGRGRPERDMVLPPNQPIVLRDWRARTIFNAREVRLAAQRLIDGSVIRAVTSPCGWVRCIVLDRPAAIYVDGLEVVSGALDAVTA